MLTLLRIIGRIVLWSCAILGGLMIAAVAAGALAWLWLPQVERQSLPDAMVLEFNTADGIVEKQSDSPFAWAAKSKVLALPDLVRGLEAAARDSRVKGVVARLGTGDLGLAQVQEIRDAVLAFRRQGKFAVAFAETFGETGDANVHYYLATAFDSIYVQPSGSIDLNGIRLENPFLSEALQEIGVAVEMDRRAEYKSAMETFTEPALTEPSRQNLQRLVDGWVQQIADGIAATRPGFTAETARQLIDNGPYLAEDALARGLVDGLLYWSSVGDEVDQRSGGASWTAFNDYAAALDRAPGDAPLVALVHGIGPVTLATSENDPVFGTVTMGSDTVADALRTAVDDPDVAAILFRVDSPGGSYVAADTIWAEVKRARDLGKPVIVSMGNVAGSGGYFVAAAADTIVAQPATITGSIGVFAIIPTFQRTLAELGVNADGVKSTPFSGAPDVLDGITPEVGALLQASVEDMYARFLRIVGAARKLPVERVNEIGQGRVWDGGTARQLKLVDHFGGLDAAVAAAAKRAGLQPDKVRTVDVEVAPPLPLQLLNSLFSSDKGETAPPDALTRLARVQQLRNLSMLAETTAIASGPSMQARCIACAGLRGAPAAAKTPPPAWLKWLLQ